MPESEIKITIHVRESDFAVIALAYTFHESRRNLSPAAVHMPDDVRHIIV